MQGTSKVPSLTRQQKVRQTTELSAMTASVNTLVLEAAVQFQKGNAGSAVLHQSHRTRVLPAHLLLLQVLQGQYRHAHEVKLSTDALYESELAATHQSWELVVELKQNKLVSKQQGEQPDHRIGSGLVVCLAASTPSQNRAPTPNTTRGAACHMPVQTARHKS